MLLEGQLSASFGTDGEPKGHKKVGMSVLTSSNMSLRTA